MISTTLRRGMPWLDRRVFIIATSFGNCGSLPLVVCETLSRMKPLVDDADAEDKLTTYSAL